MERNHIINDVDFNYIEQQLQQGVSKIKLLDGSIDLEATKQQLIAYYTEKYKDLNQLHFQYDFVDLFCGAGGLSVGLEQEGFRPIFAVDKDKAALSTYRFHRPWLSEKNVIQEDIRYLVDKDIFPHVPVVVGGPPCQGFSVVNKHKKENDERNELYKFFVHSVEQADPELFLMENVEGILQRYDDIRADFEKVGYLTCPPLILNTKDFGFPQSRKRAFILGISARHSQIVDELFDRFRSAVLRDKVGAKYTLNDAISDLPGLEAKTMKNATYVESQKWGYTYAGFF